MVTTIGGLLNGVGLHTLFDEKFERLLLTRRIGPGHSKVLVIGDHYLIVVRIDVVH